MRLLVAVVASLVLAPVAQARVLPLERVYPNGSGTEWGYKNAPLIGISSNIVPNYPWSRVTVAWNSSNGNVLVGCRGAGIQTVRVWTHGHGWRLTTCIGTEPWRVVLRRITPAVHLEAIVTFR